MSADWFSSVVIALWHPEGIESDALSNLRCIFQKSGARFARYLPPHWFVAVFEDSTDSRRCISEITSEISKVESMKGIQIGQEYGLVLMDFDSKGICTTHPTGKPMHGAMRNAQMSTDNVSDRGAE